MYLPSQLASEGNADELAVPVGNLRGLMSEPAQRQISIAAGGNDVAGFWPTENLAGKIIGNILQFDSTVVGQMRLQPFVIVPFGHGGGG